MASASEKEIDALSEEIRALEETLADRTRVLNDKKREQELESVDLDEAKAAAAAAEQKLAAAQEDFRVAEQTRAALLPQYERCQQNKDQHEKAEEFKREIGRTERSMREADDKIKALESRLQQVSSEYKSEREKRSLLVDRVVTMLEELRSSVEEKVMLTLPIDESTTVPHAGVCFRAICENARERETTIARCARHASELAAIVQMKQQRVQELRVESDRDIAALKAVKDEQIKRMVLKFDEERRSIQQDIDTVAAANADQQRQLRNTRHIAAEAPTSYIGDRTVGGAKRDAARNTSTVVLAKKTKELEQERDALNAELQTASLERQRLLKTMKDLTIKIQERETEHQRNLQNVDNQIQRDKNRAIQIERENQKLEDVCDLLVASIQAARRALQAEPHQQQQ